MNEWVDHFEELRRRIIAVLVVFFAATLVAFILSSRIAEFLFAPVNVFGARLYVFAPAEKFMAYLRLSAWTGAVVTAPFCCLQIGLFLWPGLHGNEYRYAAAGLFVIPVLFLLGAGMCYRFIAPLVFGFFLSFASGDGVEPLWSLREYLALLFNIMIASGMLLQLPLALFALITAKLVSPELVARYRPHIILLIFFLAAVFSPPDVISQIMLGTPLYLLFEGALWLGKFFLRLRRG